MTTAPIQTKPNQTEPNWTSISAISSQQEMFSISSESKTYFYTTPIFETLHFHTLHRMCFLSSAPPPSAPPSSLCHSPGALCAALTLRLPLRFDSDANTHGVWGCGTVSMETTIWVVWTETFWKQEMALHKFSWKEVFCAPSQWTLGVDSFPR